LVLAVGDRTGSVSKECEAMRRVLHGRRLIGVLAVVAAMVATLAGTAVAAPGGDPGPPPWAPGPGGSDVIHVMHGNDAHLGGSRRSASPLLSYHGGAVQTVPAAYLVFWGSQWNGNDPSGEAPVLQKFLGGLYGSADTWSTSTTQYCQSVAVRSTNCGTATALNMVAHPANSPLLDAPALFDNTVVAPSNPTQSDLAAEAVRAAGLVKASVNTKAQFVIATAHNNNATGFGSSYCAWHSSTSSPYGNLAYTNLPYMTDAGASCGAGFVNGTGTAGALDGVTIVSGHEYAETVTDPFPNSGWLDANGLENGDKCSWISSGQGQAANVTIASGTFPVQSLWSNNYKNIGGCVIRYASPTDQG
jgi:hypothetical protein